METVTISLERYHELTEFKREIGEGKVLYKDYGFFEYEKYITNDEAVNNLSERVIKLIDENEKLRCELNDLKGIKYKPKEDRFIDSMLKRFTPPFF